MIDLVLIVATAAAAILLFQPRLLRSRDWRATVTPLASIVGSGFLVCGPILSDAAAELAWLAMAGLCALAYLFGSAVRHNIAMLDTGSDILPAFRALDRAADLTLACCYFVSVAYYLNLFSAFGLRLAHVTDPTIIRCGATVAIAVIGGIGLAGGLSALERLELGAVALKLSVIAGLLAALAVAFAFFVVQGGTPALLPRKTPGLHEITVLLGLVVMVQGFETSRYLGEEYDAATRISSMRRAQWIATAIYIAFIFLGERYFRSGLPATGAETAVIDMLRPLGSAVLPLLIAAALASQSSAAIADINGAAGLLSEETGRRASVRIGNLSTALAAIALTWMLNIFEIIAYASKAFAAYYGLQAAIAAWACWREGRLGRAVVYGAGVVVAITIVVVSAPAEV